METLTAKTSSKPTFESVYQDAADNTARLREVRNDLRRILLILENPDSRYNENEEEKELKSVETVMPENTVSFPGKFNALNSDSHHYIDEAFKIIMEIKSIIG